MCALTLTCWLGVIASELVQAQERSVDLSRFRFDCRFIRLWLLGQVLVDRYVVGDCAFYGTRVFQRAVGDSQVEFRMSPVDLIDRCLEYADNGPDAVQPVWRRMYSMTSP